MFLQEHGKKAVQSYRRAGQLNFGEKRCKKKHALKLGDAIAISKIICQDLFQWAGMRRGLNTTIIDRSALMLKVE